MRLSGRVLTTLGRCVGWIEYDARIDVARPQIFYTSDDLCNNWRKSQPAPCACDGIDVVIDLRDEYDGEFQGRHWPARACFAHRCITSNRTPPE